MKSALFEPCATRRGTGRQDCFWNGFAFGYLTVARESAAPPARPTLLY